MKGLMVSLIIVIFAGVSSSVSAAGLQSGEGAAGFRPRLEFQPLGALERPGPDDSEDEVVPAPPSLLSRNSTTTSNSFGSRQSGSQPFNHPAPAGEAQRDIIFEVPIDDDAVNKLRQGLMVYSPVDVRDRTNRALPPEVVKEIALFRNANGNKEDMNAVRLEPEALEPGSRTLRFEIDEQQLNRIEQDAFVYSVPDQLRGRFDRVEFVRAGGPVVSQAGLSGGAVGNEFGLTNRNDASRFNSDPSSRFGSTSNSSKLVEQRNLPQPGPNFDPGGSEFVGPVIEPSIIDARRNRVAPLDSNQNYRLGSAFPGLQDDRPVLSASDRYDPQNEPNVRPKQLPLGWVGETGDNQGVFDRRSVSGQRSGLTVAEQRLAALQEQLAIEKAESAKLARSVSEWQGEAGRIAQERDNYSERLREASNRRNVQQAVADRSTGYREESSGGVGQAFEFAGNAARNYGTRREDFQTQATIPVAFTQVEADQRDLQARYERLLKNQGALEQVNQGLEERLQQQQQGQGVPHRSGPAENQLQPISYNSERTRVASAGSEFDPNSRADRMEVERREAPDRPKSNSNDELDEAADSGSSGGASDLLWLIPLLLMSVGLNVFLWSHCRTLDLRYSDLADELRDMVGASTVV